ncbi:hypothetical protein AAFF_G00252150 [Aldrovandia affinis]|uniref:Syntaxin N-terminal domain-containing protein n=1 Tax=Aldrovandia affinis TaxID=143900 RepID=A0AAD7STZ1_9TELE|nr:hypothetical protein AAFF_G00252150 [Aldrovandia affinis]
MRDRLADLTVSCENESGEVPFAVEPESFLEGFLRKVEEARRLVDKISSQVEEVKNKHSCILSAPDPDERTKEDLAWLNGAIKRNANAVRDHLKAMQEDLPQDENAN